MSDQAAEKLHQSGERNVSSLSQRNRNPTQMRLSQHPFSTSSKWTTITLGHYQEDWTKHLLFCAASVGELLFRRHLQKTAEKSQWRCVTSKTLAVTTRQRLIQERGHSLSTGQQRTPRLARAPCARHHGCSQCLQSQTQSGLQIKDLLWKSVTTVHLATSWDLIAVSSSKGRLVVSLVWVCGNILW